MSAHARASCRFGLRARVLVNKLTPELLGKAALPDAAKSLDRFFAVFSLDLLCIFGMDGYFKRLSPSWGATFGYTDEESCARPILDFVHEGDRAATRAEMVEIAEERATLRFTNRYLCKDGSHKWLEWMAVAYGEDQLIYAAARDISDRRKSEQMKNALSVRDAHQQGRVETASGILHDLGNALTGIGARAVAAQNTLQRATVTDKLVKTAVFLQTNAAALSVALGAPRSKALVDLMTTMAETQAKAREDALESLVKLLAFLSHAQELITTHRAYSGAGSGPSRESMSLRKLLFDAHLMMSDAMEKRRGVILIQCAPGLPNVLVERSKLMRVLINLIKNAVEAFDTDPPAKSPEITLVAESSDRGVRVEVRDNGAGFDAAQAAQLFAEGFTTKSRGSGLGLAASQLAMQSMGGVLELESDGPGKGAVARITFLKETLVQ